MPYKDRFFDPPLKYKETPVPVEIYVEKYQDFLAHTKT